MWPFASREPEVKPRVTIKCQNCKHLIEMADGFKVEERRGSSYVNYLYYCVLCKKPYDYVNVDLEFPESYSYFKKIPEKKIPCREDGSSLEPKEANPYV